jgi:catechol O-methyltransferase
MKLGERIPMLRWSFWRMAAGMKNLTTTGQIGDGREAAAVRYVQAHARRGDIDDVIATIDTFAYTESFLVNVGDHKGRLLDDAVRRADPRLVLELGTYCGYGALRIAAAAPTATVCSVELSEANAENARAIWEHAGVADRVTCVVGTIGDGGSTLDRLAAEHGFGPGALDFVFLDHDKDAYESDLTAIERRGWLRPGAIVVADNVRVPGAPEYRAFMRRRENIDWHTVEHKTRGEYGSVVPDLVLESTYLGGGDPAAGRR